MVAKMHRYHMVQSHHHVTNRGKTYFCSAHCGVLHVGAAVLKRIMSVALIMMVAHVHHGVVHLV
jgi:hypothetical protein